MREGEAKRQLLTGELENLKMLVRTQHGLWLRFAQVGSDFSLPCFWSVPLETPFLEADTWKGLSIQTLESTPYIAVLSPLVIFITSLVILLGVFLKAAAPGVK